MSAVADNLAACLPHLSLVMRVTLSCRPGGQARTCPKDASQLIAFALRFPDRIFRLLARRMLAVAPEARSSMWEDLGAGRRTEIDYIQARRPRCLGPTAPM
jgi:ketopantoate reductase